MDAAGRSSPTVPTSPGVAGRRVAYISSSRLTTLASRLPSNLDRSRQVHELVLAMDLVLEDDDDSEEQGKARLLAPKVVGKKALTTYLDGEFADFLLADGKVSAESNPPPSPSSSSASSNSDSSPERPSKRTKSSHPCSLHARFGLMDDSPPFEGLGEYCLLVAGGALAAAEEVREGRADVGICWDGGRHHAKRSTCSGFCYVNDCVLAILALSEKKLAHEAKPGKRRRVRVMYIDFDVHHGDGVAEAFLSTHTSKPSVLTLSIHHHAPFFFPSSPASALTSTDTQSPHTLSLPLAEGTSPTTLARVWSLVENVKASFQPDFVVVCCGVDGLAGDGKGVWNLGSGNGAGELSWVVRKICDWGLGTVLLGGGGYNHPSAARAWAQFTSVALGRPTLPSDHPLPIEELSDEFLESYAPTYDLGVLTGNMQDRNTEEDLANVERVFGVLAERIRLSA